MAARDVITPLGENLIFLASQPRAGSTLLQRMLAGHPQVHTTPEPWFMLEPCYALKTGGRWAEYEAGGWARQARDEFLGRIGGRATLVAGIRAMAREVYGAALNGSGKPRFLDKTPRYYAILPELREVFPEAHVILLLRNPLSVLCSVVRTWVQSHWERMPSYREDLLAAPRLLAQAIAAGGPRLHVLRHETLVAAPEACLRDLCGKLELPFDPAMLAYAAADLPASNFGDPSGGLQSDARGDRWTSDIRDPALWRLCSDYLDYLQGTVPGLLDNGGTVMRATLEANRPGGLALKRAPSLASVMRTRETVPGVL